MSDTLTTKGIDAYVLGAVGRSGGVDAEGIARMLHAKIFPNDKVRRLRAVKRSLQRLRKDGAVFFRPAWHVSDV